MLGCEWDEKKAQTNFAKHGNGQFLVMKLYA